MRAAAFGLTGRFLSLLAKSIRMAALDPWAKSRRLLYLRHWMIYGPNKIAMFDQDRGQGVLEAGNVLQN